MKERSFYTCDAEKARNGHIEMHDYDPRGILVHLVEWEEAEDLDDGVQAEKYYSPLNPFAEASFFLIVAASEEHAEQLVREFLNDGEVF